MIPYSANSLSLTMDVFSAGKSPKEQNSPLLNEVASVLIAEKTQAKATEQFENGNQIVSVDSDDIPLRLYKTGAGTINLEMLISTPMGTFFKPFGFYHRNGAVYAVNELEQVLTEMGEWRGRKGGSLKRLNLEANAVIAAFSVDSLLVAHQQSDAKYVTNGMKMEAYINSNGDPQIWADDSYGFSQAIAVYESVSGMVNPGVIFAKAFRVMDKLSLLSAFKSL